MPVVTVRSRPNGLPIATTGSPTSTLTESPSVERLAGPSCRRSPSAARRRCWRRCRRASRRRSCRRRSRPRSCVAPSTTCALVRMWPSLSITKPEPVASPRCAWGRPNGDWLCWIDLGADEHDARAVALVDLVDGQAARRSSAFADRLDDGALDDGRLRPRRPSRPRRRSAPTISTTRPPSSAGDERVACGRCGGAHADGRVPYDRLGVARRQD